MKNLKVAIAQLCCKSLQFYYAIADPEVGEQHIGNELANSSTLKISGIYSFNNLTKKIKGHKTQLESVS